MMIIAPVSSANAVVVVSGAAVVVVRMLDGVVMVEAVEETMEKEEMGIGTKNNWARVWRETILKPDDDSALVH